MFAARRSKLEVRVFLTVQIFREEGVIGVMHVSDTIRICKKTYKLLVILAIYLILIGGPTLSGQVAAQALNEPAPEFQLSALDGSVVSNYSLEGEPALLMFWAPWCGVCQRELPKLAQYHEGEKPDGLQIVTIGGSASRGRVKGYVEDHWDTFVFPTAYDDGKLVAGAFGIRAFPTYVLLDQDGTIRLIHRGSGVLQNRKFHQLAD